MVGEACLPSNAYYPRTPDYTLCSWVHVCWSEHSDSSFVYGFMSSDYGFGTMTALLPACSMHYSFVCSILSGFMLASLWEECSGRLTNCLVKFSDSGYSYFFSLPLGNGG